jgi:putative FmdB family regulatory protein
MPNYEYLCHGCGHTFEEFFKMDDRKKPEKKPCPQCKQKKVKQECLTAPSVAMDTNMRVDGPAKGGFKDVMNKVIGGPSMKGTKAAKMMKDRYGL